MNWREMFILYNRELKTALRERSIVVTSILIPVFLYPVILWFIFSGFSFVMGQAEGFVARIALSGLPARHGELTARFRSAENIKLTASGSGLQEAEATALIRKGDLDAFLEFGPALNNGSALAGNFEVKLVYDSSRDRSVTAWERAVNLLDDYRSDWLQREAVGRGLSEDQWQQYKLRLENLASTKEMGSFVLGQVLPLFMVLMVVVGCFYPAIDSTAGERERSTWETLITTSVSRQNIVTAKYLYVATMGAAAGLLNLAAMTVSMGSIFKSFMQDYNEVYQFSFPYEAFPVITAGVILLALFAAAGMMVFASFARTFKEGQSMIVPFYIVIILPLFLVQSPQAELTFGQSLIPVANVALVFREAITGQFNLPLIGLTFLVEIITIVVCLKLATRILRFEDVMLGSYQGSLFTFIRRWLFPGNKGG